MTKKITKQQAKRTRDENAKAIQAKQLEKLNAAYERATGRGTKIVQVTESD